MHYQNRFHEKLDETNLIFQILVHFSINLVIVNLVSDDSRLCIGACSD
jgi:uncharacterized membrane protein